MAPEVGRVAEAAVVDARLEDDLIFNGSKALGVRGPLNGAGNKADLTSWAKACDVAADAIKALTTLEDSSFHGPYTLALAPSRYSLILRHYPQGDQVEMQHLSSMVTVGIFRAPILKEGGVLLPLTPQYHRNYTIFTP